MARKLSDQSRSEYVCIAKRCPNPADLARFPELRREVSKEWRARLEFMRSGQARARRVAAKFRWKGRRKKK